MMKDQQFNERAHANPHDDSTEFLEAAASSPERQQLVVELDLMGIKRCLGVEHGLQEPDQSPRQPSAQSARTDTPQIPTRVDRFQVWPRGHRLPFGLGFTLHGLQRAWDR